MQQALKILSDAEKQIRLSSERSTWFTAALLQLGSSSLSDTNHSRTSSKQSARTYTNSNKDRTLVDLSENASNCNSAEKRASLKSGSEEKLGEIWRRCIEKCHLKTLRQLLFDHGKLVSINENEGENFLFCCCCYNQLMPRTASCEAEYIESLLCGKFIIVSCFCIHAMYETLDLLREEPIRFLVPLHFLLNNSIASGLIY